MAADGTGDGWSTDSPGDHSTVSTGPIEIRDLRAGVGLRVAKEHLAPADGSVGGEHLAGSAVVYQDDTTAPTLRPDTVTPLDTDDNGRLWIKTNKLAWWNGTAWISIVATSDVRLEERHNPGVASGDLTAATWNARVLNTKVFDANSICALDSGTGQFNLGSGNYRVRASASAYKVDGHMIRLLNVTDNTVIATGTSEFASPTGDNSSTRSELTTEFSITGTKTFALQHNCTTSRSSNGKGQAASINNELYSFCDIQKL